MDEIHVERRGSGNQILLVHGGAAPGTTWSGLAPLEARWQLATAYRRGYPPSPTAADGQDWEVDAVDIGALLDQAPAHVVAHSYGTLAALIAVGRRPGRAHSLTLIEPPIYHLNPGDEEIARLARLGDEVLTLGLDADPTVLREFLQLAGAPALGAGPLPGPVAAGVERAHGGRLPGGARPDLGSIRGANVPCLVASGDHFTGLDRICDALAAALGARRLVAPGAGHFVAGAPGFAGQLERFLDAAEEGRAGSRRDP